MELGKKQVLVLCTIFSILVWDTTQAACVPKKKILFEDVTPNNPDSSKPESPPHAQTQRQPQPSNPVLGWGVGLGAGAVEKAMNPPLEDMQNALNPVLGAVQGVMNPAISKICDQAEYKDLCATTIGPLFTGKTDILSVMGMLIKGCETGATQAKEAALKLKAQADASNQNSFSNCISNFDDALDYLKEGLAALEAKDIPTAQTQLSAAISLTSTCDDNFSDEPDPEATGENPMEKIDQNLINMIGNALAVLNNNKASL